MPITSFSITHARASDYRGTESMTARNVVSRILSFLTGCAGGTLGATALEVGTAAASGTVTLSSASGAIAVYVGGASVEVTASGGDAATAAAIAAEINDAGSPMTDWVSATASGAVVTITAKAAGPLGNAVPLAVTGTGATTSGDTLSGGTFSSYSF